MTKLYKMYKWATDDGMHWAASRSSYIAALQTPTWVTTRHVSDKLQRLMLSNLFYYTISSRNHDNKGLKPIATMLTEASVLCNTSSTEEVDAYINVLLRFPKLIM